MVCVVCERDIVAGEEVFANDWERTRRRFPCCGAPCATEFKQDVHWMPGEEPRPPKAAEEQRLVAFARRRLLAGDQPTRVARDLFVAGVPSPMVRAALDGALIGVERSKKQNREAWWWLLLAGIGVFKREKRDPQLVEQAYASIEQWRLRAKRWKQNRDMAASARLR
jgi:hypothetical protein